MSNSLPQIAIVGSPNSGKTTLFNFLTGSRQKTANYAGVTVEKKEGLFSLGEGVNISLIDLPGTYSISSSQSPDEAITADIVLGKRTHEPLNRGIVAVADSTNLGTNLYLVLELIELGLPMVLCLTMSDLAKKSGLQIDEKKLEASLGIPVVLVSCLKGIGMPELKSAVSCLLEKPVPQSKSIQTSKKSDAIIQRYKRIEEILKICVKANNTSRDVTKSIDRIVLHRIFGPIILFSTLAVLFQMIFTVAEVPMNAIEGAIGWLQNFVTNLLPDSILRSLFTDGILAGVGSVVVFLPQILILFTFILLLEDSGYMARAAFIMDRLMNKVGLHGRAFIPLLSSFACAVPGIMSTRTIDHPRDRLITILVAPLMTCSARIPIYTMLVSAFIPNTPVFWFFTVQGLVMMGLYLSGVLAALTVAFVLRKFVFKGSQSSFVMELPTYKVPVARNLVLSLWQRAKAFLYRAGTIILGVSLILWLLVTFPKVEVPSGLDSSATRAYQIENSAAGKLGKFIEPAIRPLGYDWKIGVGILASFAAREVVLSTLGTVYSVSQSEDNHELLAKRLAQDPNFSLATALSLLVFYVLACQCVSTLAVTHRETNSWVWPAVMFIYMTLLAYLAAFITYQIFKTIIL